MNNFNRNIALLVFLALFSIILINAFQGPNERGNREIIQYSDFWNMATQKNIAEAEIKGNVVTGTKADKSLYKTYIPQNDSTLAQRLTELGVKVIIPPNEETNPILSMLLSYFPFILLIGVWLFFLRQMQSGNNRAMGFGKSRAKLLTEKQGKITFEDVAGIEESKQDVEEIVEFLRDPQKFQRLGGKIPKGVLLIGSPGTGKTLLARAIAGEADVPFFTISGSDFVEMFVGVGASRVRDMFEQAKKEAPCIIFIDEIDAVGRHRGAGMGGGNDEREQTLNQLLVEMDGFETNEGVILLAATNRPDVLDPALLRPGRFDRQVVVPMPDVNGREQILGVHMRKVPLGNDVDKQVIARGTPGFSGADLENLVNEAALMAARRNKKVVSMTEFEEAKDKVMMGSERRSLAMSDAEKKLTAYHEAGHAVVAYHMEHSDPIHKATIIPRGRALGMVVRLPESDRVSMTRSKLEADLAVGMGGRIAEEMIFGKAQVTTGASSDIKHVTEIARRMVTEWGMSDKLGPLAYGEPQQEVFLGHSVTQTKHMSEATAEVVDSEVRIIVDAAYDVASDTLRKYKKHLEIVAQGLLEYETLSGEEIDMLIRGNDIGRPTPSSQAKKKKPRSVVPSTEKVTKLKPELQEG
ncbi:MAG: ATP-dependent zinc metalloprotease FtsH [Alphaproteobacteria bacterium]|nr:ATP-dependent zinc metalloprotease FtsH [Alphaproteobacteria bacterium]